jgi:hypothetical protein
VTDQLDGDPFDVGLANVAHAGGADPGRGYNPNRRRSAGRPDVVSSVGTPAICTNTLAMVIQGVPQRGAARGGSQDGN